MAKYNLLTSSLSPFTASLVLLLISSPFSADSKTLESDIRVLQSIWQSIDPASITATSFLHTWDFKYDPCNVTGDNFLGILCTMPEDNSTTRVKVINLESDGLEGFLPPTLGNLTELTELNLRKNKFRGPIPDSLVNMRKITSLLLSENFFSGSMPEGIGALKRLKIIDLSNNRLSGSIPGAILGLRCLTHLSLSNNEFSERIPNLSGLWQLETLDLSGNQLHGSLPGLPINLRSLLLGHNSLTGHISSLSRLRRLRSLDLSSNRFSGTITGGILTLPDVTHVNVSANRFTEIDVIKMSNKPSKLRVIEAQSNWIRGRLPLNLITYQKLMDVNLGHNLFSGEIPVKYGKMVASGVWKSLFLDYNWLEGNVPPGLMHSRIEGSLAHNCLNCTRSVPICGRLQKQAAECYRHH